MNFKEIDLQKEILDRLEKNNYLTLTPVQEKIIPEIIKGNDVLGCSQTGSGKTGAFLIPILSNLIKNKNKKAIILAPTRELAIQIMDTAKLFCEKEKVIGKALLIGGASIKMQLLLIMKSPRFIVGTPGRINDFLESKKLNLENFETLVLDEMDRMLDMGFSVQIDKIIENLPKKRQTMLFSATMSKKIEKVTEKYLKDPVVVKIGETNQPSSSISQEIIEIKNNDNKFEKLVEKLKGNTIFTIVFVKTKYSTERIANKLVKENIMARAIHGDFKQSKRAKIIEDFRNKKFNVLVATDLAARGLDIHHIDTVINYDLPQSPEDYIHRIGRCSRGIDTKGCSISFYGKNDKKIMDAINSLMEIGDYDESELNHKKAPSRNSPNKRRTSNKKFSNKTKKDLKTDIESENNKTEKFNRNNDKRKKNFRIDNKKTNNKSEDKNKKQYDINKLISKEQRFDIKRKGAYLVSKEGADNRRKRLGL